jgi:hypothetical protein
MLSRTTSKLGSTLDVAEVNALIRYAMEKKKDEDALLIPLLEEAKSDWEKNKDDSEKYNCMLRRYVALSAETAPVSGRVLLDSEHSGRHLCFLVFTTMLLILVAAAEGVLKLAMLDLPTPDKFEIFSLNGTRLVLEYINPFLWGALGACVYLLKHLYDIVCRQEFDAVLFRGWWVRLVLGAVMGGVVTQTFNFQSDATVAVAHFSKTAVAFLTGLGVRVVYGAFERAVQILADKMNIRQVTSDTTAQTAAIDARSVLVEELAQVDPKSSPEKHKLLLDMIAKFGGKKMPDQMTKTKNEIASTD